jgi:hypothetical protein
MKKSVLFTAFSMLAAALLIVSCSTPVGLTSWKNPEAKGTISKIVVLGIFDKMSIVQPVEEQAAAYFNAHNLPTVQALNIMNPFQQYSKEALKAKLDSVGADGIVIMTYKSTDVNVNYSPGFYGGYRGYWGGGGNLYVDKTYNLRAMLYGIQNDVLLWSGDLTVTDPNDATSAAQQVAQAIFNDWVAKGLLKNPPPPPQK